ncbi:hypothetical protein [Piscibacillus salipiscarius]|uniref:hypothetical protein n=1 Tax=Piscibacillus salipiscarius TaxID=299480 RepID=UPI0024371069|nr:hypothetical protein [Piscibacillus salipiscarius]
MFYNFTLQVVNGGDQLNFIAITDNPDADFLSLSAQLTDTELLAVVEECLLNE